MALSPLMLADSDSQNRYMPTYHSFIYKGGHEDDGILISSKLCNRGLLAQSV